MKTRLSHVSEVAAKTGAPMGSIEAELFRGRHEARLGKAVGLTQFGVNRVCLDPGSVSSLRHWHEAEDEFVYVLSGELTLVDEYGVHTLTEGSFVGFLAGEANAHQLRNDSCRPATFLVVGSRRPGMETIHYPNDAICFVHK